MNVQHRSNTTVSRWSESAPPPRSGSKACDWLGEACRRVLGGPWRLTEPCDVTIGGATWLDQAQETAARTNQNEGPHRRKAGRQRAAPVVRVEGVEKRQTAAGPNREEAGSAEAKTQSRLPASGRGGGGGRSSQPARDGQKEVRKLGKGGVKNLGTQRMLRDKTLRGDRRN